MTKHGKSKTKLRSEVGTTKARNADLWDEVLRLRALATAVRLFLEDENTSPPIGKIWELEDAASKAGIFEDGPGKAIAREERRSTVRTDSQSQTLPVRSKDPLTERRYQEDQAVLGRDGWQPFGDDDWELG